MDLFHQLFNHYNDFHASGITTNRFSCEDFQQELQKEAGNFRIQEIGKSVEGRAINAISIGNGPIKVFLWSQMHGNESTATRAILDILKFFNQRKNFTNVQEDLVSRLTIYIVPMLNPDGANRFQRRNALEIDLNRDARAFEAPESRILKEIISDFKPDFAFNLHDQRRFYNISGTAKPSTMAFLAPAYDKSEAINDSRKMAMQLIAQLRNWLEAVIPGQVGIYDDCYSPRAFGDYTQRTGASTILIESGWAKDDMEKEFVRKLNFCTIVSAFEAISKDNFTDLGTKDYLQIPMNDEKLFDVLIRNVKIKSDDREFRADIGIQRTETLVPGSNSYFSTGKITDIGDLKEWFGFIEIDASDLHTAPGLLYTKSFNFKMDNIQNLLREEYLYLFDSEGQHQNFVNQPINIAPQDYTPPAKLRFEGLANFLLQDAEGTLKYIIINGFLWNVDESMAEGINGLVIR